MRIFIFFENIIIQFETGRRRSCLLRSVYELVFISSNEYGGICQRIAEDYVRFVDLFGKLCRSVVTLHQIIYSFYVFG